MTYIRPSWLPEIIECSGEWHGTLARLHDVFTRDFTIARPRFRGMRLWWDMRKDVDGYEEGFWHLISRTDQGSGDRVPDYRRAERICWCKPLIEHVDEPEVTTWNADHQGKVRSYLWLQEEDYVVILAYRASDIAMLVTAYHVDGESTRRKLRRSYDSRL